MNIGFDAKRAFHNGTGLGHYSRSLLQALDRYHPEHEYYLFNPKPASHFKLEGAHLHEIRPTSILSRTFSSAWRSSWVKKDLEKQDIHLYHGLSHEIPIGIQTTGIPSVVTIHDLIHERYPEQYNRVDVSIYNRKFRYACKHANRIIAISEQTKNDIVSFYGTEPARIDVCYQSCNPAFGQMVSEAEKKRIRSAYNLPEKFFLSVGSIIERKNLLNICKAVFLLRNELDIPLVVIGDGGKYKQLVKDFVRQNGLTHKILFLSETAPAQGEAFKTATDFPAIYQSAIAMIYPSFFEGFGIPVLEALTAGLPVITSNVSCLPEAGGPGSYYVDPHHADEIASAMRKIERDSDYRQHMIEKGREFARQFEPRICADRVMATYQKIINQ